MDRVAAASLGLLLGSVVLVGPSPASACGGACLTEGGRTIGVLLGIAVGAWAVFRGAACD